MQQSSIRTKPNLLHVQVEKKVGSAPLNGFFFVEIFQFSLFVPPCFTLGTGLFLCLYVAVLDL